LRERGCRGIDIKHMAELLDITEKHFMLIESGKRHPGLALLSRVWKTLGITPDNLFLENYSVDNVYTSKEKDKGQKVYAVTTLVKNLPNDDIDIVLGLIRALWVGKRK